MGTAHALAAALVLAAALAGCTSAFVGPEEDYPSLTGAVGTVAFASLDDPLLIRVERPRPTVVVPDRPLPVRLRQDGLRVVFSGELLPVPPNVRVVGEPVRLTRIRRAR